MQIRPATEGDLDALLALPVDAAVGSPEAQRLREDLSAGRLRWPWTWLAIDDGELVGRALWWGRADSTTPLSLDWLDVLAAVADRTRLATDLLDRAHRSLAGTAPGGSLRPPPYELALRPRWREEPAVVDAVTWRTQAAVAHRHRSRRRDGGLRRPLGHSLRT